MPSLRKKVSSYFRQLSFHNEPREKRNSVNENSFVNRYLRGEITLIEGPPVLYGKTPTDLPNYELSQYEVGSDTIVGCYTGPNGGLTTVKRTEKHLSILDADIDFIDTSDEPASSEPPKPPKVKEKRQSHPVDNTTMVIKVAGQEYCVTNRMKRKHSKSQSLGSVQDFKIEIDKTKIERELKVDDEKKTRNSLSRIDAKNEFQNDKEKKGEIDVRMSSKSDLNQNTIKCEEKVSAIKKDSIMIEKNSISNEGKPLRNCKLTNVQSNRKAQEVVAKVKRKDSIETNERTSNELRRSSKNYALSKSKSEGNPFGYGRKGKIIRIAQRPIVGDETNRNLGNTTATVNLDSTLPEEWNRKSDCVYGLSDSLYDRNQVTKNKNGDPIADCFGIIARGDSAILALADGVNWGEKACLAAKSAVHGSLHYLNKTIFNDTSPFDNLVKTENNDTTSSTAQKLDSSFSENRISNTREVFVCLLRAFNCAHDLILENKGMLTTLTVAIVLPLKQNKTNLSDQYPTYICCVCNVGDTLAYVYSPKTGVREITKGSHDINCNRDMRDALGALGPVEGIKPELSNLTLSLTTLYKGDIVLIASDGLTDNFDPNVCKFTVSLSDGDFNKTKRQVSTSKREYKDLRQKDVKTNTVGVKKSIAQEVVPSHPPQEKPKPPVKPPRRSKNRDNISRSCSERSDSKEKSSSKVNLETLNVSSDMSSSSNLNSDKTLQNPKVAEPKTDELPKSSNAESREVKDASSDFNVPSSTAVSSDSNVPLSVVSKEEAEGKSHEEVDNPLIAQFLMQNSLDETTNYRAEIKPKAPSNRISSQKIKNLSTGKEKQKVNASLPRKIEEKPDKNYKLQYSKSMDVRKQTKNDDKRNENITVQRYGFLRSKTSVDIKVKSISRNPDGMPYVSPLQRYELMLLLMEDILKKGLSGREKQCVSSKKLCENLVHFTFSMTSGKRHTLEDNDMYFDSRNGILVEVSQQEKKARRKRGLEKVQNLPGKLDHVSVVAYNVGNFML